MIDLADLIKIGASLDVETVPRVGAVKDSLTKAVKSLNTAGSTALGPALALALGMASHYKQSEVFVCTDGLANCGIGANETSTTASRQKSKEAYRSLGEIAQAQNTIISIIGIEGEAMAMDNLSLCAEQTQGSVNIVRPLELRREMRTQAQKRIIGREVVVKMFLPPPFVVSQPVTAGSDDTSDKDKLQQGGSVIIRNFKAITDDSELTLEFGVRSKDVKWKIDPSKPAIFQAQITFTKPDGSRCMRTITNALDVVDSRQEAEHGANVAVVAQTAVRRAAVLAQSHLHEQARDRLVSVHALLQRAAVKDEQQEELGEFVKVVQELEQQISRCLREGSSRKRSYADDVASKAFVRMKESPLHLFLAGKNKAAIVQRRNALVRELRGCA